MRQPTKHHPVRSGKLDGLWYCLCWWCGNTFTARRADAKTCSNACRKARSRFRSPYSH